MITRTRRGTTDLDDSIWHGSAQQSTLSIRSGSTSTAVRGKECLAHQHPPTPPINTTHQDHPSTPPTDTTHQHHPSHRPATPTNAAHPHRPATPPSLPPTNTTHRHHPSTPPTNTAHQHQPPTQPISTTHQHHPSTPPPKGPDRVLMESRRSPDVRTLSELDWVRNPSPDRVLTSGLRQDYIRTQSPDRVLMES